MINDRDPRLLELFANAEQDLAAEAFVERLSLQTGKLKRRALAGRIGLGLLLVIFAWFSAATMQQAVDVITQSITVPLIVSGDNLMVVILAPISTVAGILALGLLGLWTAYRSLLS